MKCSPQTDEFSGTQAYGIRVDAYGRQVLLQKLKAVGIDFADHGLAVQGDEFAIIFARMVKAVGSLNPGMEMGAVIREYDEQE
jgi:hypothetical protein